MNALNIEIFSDLICPWCYIGRRRLEAGLKILGANELPNIIWRPFELNPDMPKAGLDRKASSALVGERQRLARRFGGRPLPSLLHGRTRHREK